MISANIMSDFANTMGYKLQMTIINRVPGKQIEMLICH